MNFDLILILALREPIDMEISLTNINMISLSFSRLPLGYKYRHWILP